MFVAVVLSSLLLQASADSARVKYRCNDREYTADTTTLTRSLDNIKGRYTAELCTQVDPAWTNLTMVLTYYKSPTLCTMTPKQLRSRVRRPGTPHSSNTVDITGLTNCSHVCYAMDFDLIFKSCYQIKSTFVKGSTTDPPIDSYHLIDNNITREHYDEIKPHVNIVNHDDSVSLQWFLQIPAVDYNVTLHKKKNNTTESTEVAEVTQNCTVSSNVEMVNCVLAPAYGCYIAAFEHGGLWTSGHFNNKIYIRGDFCHEPPEKTTVSGGNTALLWACGGVVLALAALALAELLRRKLPTFCKPIIKVIVGTEARSEPRAVGVELEGCGEGEAESAVERDSRDVLVLYAREGELGDRAMAALQELLQDSTTGNVYSLYSARCVAAGAAALQAWLRALVLHPDVRVLLVQTPALTRLYSTSFVSQGNALRLREPLLGRSVAYRAPCVGDELLLLALRLLSDTAALHDNYNKLYIATYRSLRTEMLDVVVPYRRYELPDAGAALVQALSGAAPRAAPLRALRHALLAHAQHALADARYLDDLLVSLDPPASW